MKIDEILKLVNAGYSKDEIVALETQEPTPEPSPEPNPEPKPEPIPEPKPTPSLNQNQMFLIMISLQRR